MTQPDNSAYWDAVARWPELLPNAEDAAFEDASGDRVEFVRVRSRDGKPEVQLGVRLGWALAHPFLAGDLVRVVEVAVEEYGAAVKLVPVAWERWIR